MKACARGGMPIEKVTWLLDVQEAPAGNIVRHILLRVDDEGADAHLNGVRVTARTEFAAPTSLEKRVLFRVHAYLEGLNPSPVTPMYIHPMKRQTTSAPDANACANLSLDLNWASIFWLAVAYRSSTCSQVGFPEGRAVLFFSWGLLITY